MKICVLYERQLNQMLKTRPITFFHLNDVTKHVRAAILLWLLPRQTGTVVSDVCNFEVLWRRRFVDDDEFYGERAPAVFVRNLHRVRTLVGRLHFRYDQCR